MEIIKFIAAFSILTFLASLIYFIVSFLMGFNSADTRSRDNTLLIQFVISIVVVTLISVIYKIDILYFADAYNGKLFSDNTIVGNLIMGITTTWVGYFLYLQIDKIKTDLQMTTAYGERESEIYKKEVDLQIAETDIAKIKHELNEKSKLLTSMEEKFTKIKQELDKREKELDEKSKELDEREKKLKNQDK